MKTTLYYLVFLLLFFALWHAIGADLSRTRVVLVSMVIAGFRIHAAYGWHNKHIG